MILTQQGNTRGGVLRPRQQWERLSVARSTYYQLRKEDPNFPPQFPLTPSGRAVGTFEADFNAYLETKAEAKLREAKK